jgi:beta-glucosidase
MPYIHFPKDFLWGISTASYQVEGGWNEEGRGLSIWDTFCKEAGKVLGGESGEIACDSYHRMEDDIRLLKELGVKAYRFSIAWPRIFPSGSSNINEPGLQYYHRLVDRLLEEGIEPVCTIYHWDLPLWLQNMGGWSNRNTIEEYVHYSEILFKEFNGKIRKWITFNEMFCVAILGHYWGIHAPGLMDLQVALLVAHHLLVAHGRAVQTFRSGAYSGEIGLVVNLEWIEPYSCKADDIQACRLERAWMKEWYLDPVFKGSYPKELLEHFRMLGAKPQVQQGDLELINQTIDFLGINYYTGGHGRYAKGSGIFDCERMHFTSVRMEIINWATYPEGMYQCLMGLYESYGAIPIYITENGYVSRDRPEDGKVDDRMRIDYYKAHITQLDRAICSGVQVRGFFAWSLMDVFEWNYGYEVGLGLVHVDRLSLERTPKNSYYWYRKVVNNGWLEL